MDTQTLEDIAILFGIVVFIIIGVVIQNKIMTKEEQKNYADSFDEFLHGDRFR